MSDVKRSNKVQKPPVLVIFGANGDLTQRLLGPALVELEQKNLLPKGTQIIGTGTRAATTSEFRERLHDRLAGFTNSAALDAVWKTFSSNVSYQQADLTSAASLAGLQKRLDSLDDADGAPHRRLFYLAVPPSTVEPGLPSLAEAQLVGEAAGDKGATLLLEKPIGVDQRTAHRLNDALSSITDESHVLRVDHFVGKPGLLDLFQLRQAEPALERMWSRDFVDSINIQAEETVGVEGRAKFYEETGTLRDMLQGHLLQALAFTMLDLPKDLTSRTLHEAKEAVLASLQKPTRAVRAQYASGPGGIGYRDEQDVPDTSARETFAAIQLGVDNARWKGVPVVLESGKALAQKRTALTVHFSHLDPELAARLGVKATSPATLEVNLAKPDELVLSAEGKSMHLAAPSSSGPQLSPYARLLRQALGGDPTLFVDGRETELQWAAVDPVEKRWESRGANGLVTYEHGSTGPELRSTLPGLELDAPFGKRVIADNPEELANVAAERIAQSLRSSLHARGSATLALSGGGTPIATLQKLARAPDLDWTKVQVFWVDERAAAPTSAGSNYRAAKNALLDEAHIPEKNVHRMPADAKDLKRAAAAYEQLLRQNVALDEEGVPVFDAMVLGLGPDGHVASLFPHEPALRRTDATVLDVPASKAHEARLSLSAPVLQRARNVFVLAQGEKQQQPLAAAQAIGPDEETPARVLQQARGSLLWLTDAAAAGLRSSRQRSTSAPTGE